MTTRTRAARSTWPARRGRVLPIVLLMANPDLPAFPSQAGSRIGPGPAARIDLPPRPAPCPERWLGLLGRYGEAEGPLVRERDGRLEVVVADGGARPLEPVAPDIFRVAGGPRLVFSRDDTGSATRLHVDGIEQARRPTGLTGAIFRITPRRPLEELRRAALAASPPEEPGPFQPVDLVELVSLDPTIRLDIRYARADNFLGVPVYPSPRAFLQRSAAEALLAAHRSLRARGYGLLIHDAYRPWWVTKVFWEATPPHQRGFVADPSRGSRHNRGCAVDLTLYRLADGRPVEMPGVYDEMSERSFPGYPGGTSLERWHRDLLRTAMEEQGFTVFEAEWWHFDFRGWRHYPILNLSFETVSP